MDLQQQYPAWVSNKTLQKPIDVILINMPFGSLQQPSIGLSLLKATLMPKHVSTKILYFTMQFANQISLPFYKYIAAGNPRNTDLIGEWIFSEALFGSQSKQKAYIEEILYKDAEMLQGASEKTTRNTRVSVDDIVSIRDNVEAFLEKCAIEVQNYQPRIVGFTSVFQQQVSSLALAKRLKEQMPNLLVLFGGANCEGIMGAEMIRQFSFIDAIVSGEGEQIFPTLVERCLAGECFDNLQGVYTQQNTSLLSVNSKFSTAPSVRNMDTLPFPDFDDFFEQWDHIADEVDLPKLLFETSRGCWWGEKHHCTFCGLNGQNMSFRSKTAHRALSEIQYLADRYPHSSVAVVDNILDMKYFKEFLPELAKKQLGLELFYEVKANLRKDQLRLLRNAGVYNIQPGIESLSSRVLEIMRKGIKGIQNIQLLKWCQELGITPHWNMIWGFPGEPPEEYTKMADLIPSLSHLTPPVAASPIRLDRFSPNYDEAEQFGFFDVTPYPAYSYIYPFPEQSLANLAYFFTYRYKDERDIMSYVHPVYKRILEWQATYKQSDLFSISKDTYLLIRDRRPIGFQPLTILTGLQHLLYDSCDGIQSLKQLRQIVVDSTGQEVSVHQIKGILQPLVDQKLMISEGDFYLGLAIPRQAHPSEKRVLRSFDE